MKKQKATLVSNCNHEPKFRKGYCEDCYPYEYKYTWVDWFDGTIKAIRRCKK